MLALEFKKKLCDFGERKSSLKNERGGGGREKQAGEYILT